MPNLFRRRPREPPSTGNFNNFARKRQPIDPPSSLPALSTGPRDPDILQTRQPEPEIQLTSQQLEILNKRPEARGIHFHNPLPHPKEPSEVGAPTFFQPVVAARDDVTKRLVSDDDFVADFQPRFHENNTMSGDAHFNLQSLPSQDENVHTGPSVVAPTKNSTGTSSTISGNQQPFATRSNKDSGMTKNLTLASRRLNKEKRPISAARSSVFRHQTKSSDNDTVTSVTSQKGVAATSNFHIRTTSSGTSVSAISAYDKTELRKLLGTGPSEIKPSISASTDSHTSKSQPAKPVAITTAPSTDEGFDQREFLRNLIQQKSGPKTRGSNTTTTTSNKLKPAALSSSVQSLKEGNDARGENVRTSNNAPATSSDVSSTIKTKSGYSSSASSSVDPMLQRVLNRSLNASKDKVKKKLLVLSPRNKGSKSPKSFSSSHKEISPKRGKSGLKNYVRKRMGFPKKADTASPRSAKDTYDAKLANSSSTDSGDRSVPQVASMSTETTDDDHTRTTLASSSNLSDDCTKRTYDNSLKQLSTAETLDTDTSSTIMGNLQSTSSLRSASSDSMQYSSEEGCDDHSMVEKKSAFNAIAKITAPTIPSGSFAYSRPKARVNNQLQLLADGGAKLRLAYPSGNQGYNTFVKALQLEASGTHSQIWSSFQSLMTGSPRKFPHRNDKNSQFKFDPPTKKMLGVMNLHLKRQALVECVSEAQLVNDKQFSKEVEAGLSLRKSSLGLDAKACKPMGVITENNETLPAENIESTHSPTTAYESIGGDEVSSQEQQMSDPSIVENEKLEMAQAAKKPDLALQNDRFEKKPRLKVGSIPESKTTLATQFAAVKLSKPRTSAGSRQSLPSPNPSSETEALIPWSGVQLRSVSSVDSSDSPHESDPHSTKRNTIPSPWAKVKLRRIPDEDMEPMERATEEQHRMQEHDPLGTEDGDNQTSALLPIQKERPANTLATNNNTRTITPDPIPAEAEPANFLDELKKQTKPSETTDKPTEAKALKDARDGQECKQEKKMDESAVIFELNNTQGVSAYGQEKVVVGTKTVELFQSNPGDSKTTVSWSLPRDHIKALKLDMESQRVSLSLVDGGEAKILAFNNSTDCLNFANAFYEMHRPSELQRNEQPPKEDTTDNKGRVEQLNDEEQQVLETYRQARRTKAPVDAMRTVVPAPALKKTLHESLLASALVSKTGNTALAKPDPETTMSSPLSEDKMKIAKSYEKMLKMRIPLEAVQHRMAKDGVDSEIVNYILGKAGRAVDTGSSDESGVQGKEEAKMKAPGKSATNLTAADEAIAAPYRKMLKMMIPKEAVSHKMAKDQIDPKIMAAVVGTSESSPKEETNLTPAEEAAAATYRRMLKLQMPHDAIRHKMEKDQMSDKVIRIVLGNKSGGNGAATKLSKPSQATERASKLVSLHWTPLSGKELDNSVWCAAKKGKVAPTQPQGSDISKLVELFQKKSTVKSVKDKGSEGDNGIGKAKLIDLNRANIVAISLKAFKDFSYDELAEILQTVDPDHKLHGERVQFVKDLLPTATEISAVKRYYGSPDRLVPAEQWFQKIVHIKRLEAKAHVLHTMEVFESEVAEIQDRLHVLTRVCNQVMESERLRELLDMVLQIGNIMNEGTRTGGASGFKFDSLLRLTQTKSGDGKTTVLDYMVTIYFAKDQKQTLDLIEDFPDCQVASRMLISDLVANVKDVSDKMTKCKKEYESLLTDNSGVAGLKKTSVAGGGVGDPRLQLLSAITAKAQGTACSETPGQQESKPVAALSNLASANSTDCKGGQTKKPNGLQAGIAKLKGFLESADRTYKKLKSDCDLAVETCREMSQYCGESGGERSTDALLGVLSEFATKLGSAVQKHERVLIAEAKKQSRQTAPLTPKKAPRTPEDMPVESSLSTRKSTPSPSPKKKKEIASDSDSKETKEPKRVSKPRPSPESKPRGKGTSLVLMVNELLKDSSEEAKKDFSQGVVYSNPDEKLKAIYEREKRAGRKGMPPLPRRSMDDDLMATIRKRQGGSDGVAAKAKRSQLERVIDCINCASASDSVSVSASAETETELSESDHPADKFADLQSKWKDQSSRSGSNRSLASFVPSEDEGSVCNPIDCSDLDDVSETGSKETSQER